MTTKPTSHYSLTDVATWVNILSVAWAVLAVIHPGFHLQAYIAPASIAAAGLVSVGVALAKHHITLIEGFKELIDVFENAHKAVPPAPAKKTTTK